MTIAEDIVCAIARVVPTAPSSAAKHRDNSATKTRKRDTAESARPVDEKSVMQGTGIVLGTATHVFRSFMV